ncbi:hypothetical protein QQS21_002074 [Conoideocrella luteorostrata]|uniref:Uncharacterized protein n=1 Tax=Conoideocrella luteorostrata TaxID=1105319 RepID=A0AAJ0FXP4_9HYPO|nr:hypothetical protein QQS21_002074 [Conoideocrella luteorostrata]
MVRASAVTLLALAASVFAVPAYQAAHHDGDEGPMLDINGKPLSQAKAAEFHGLLEKSESKFKEIVASYNPKQQKMYEELKDLAAKGDEILGVPTHPHGNSTNSSLTTRVPAYIRA